MNNSHAQHSASAAERGRKDYYLDSTTNPQKLHAYQRAKRGRLQAGVSCSIAAACATVVSHKCWFLDHIAMHILAFEDDSHAYWSMENWSDHEAVRKRRLGKGVETPRRIKYRTLKR